MEFSKRNILWVWPVLLLISLSFFNNVGVQASHRVFKTLQSVPEVNVKKMHRTGFHFQPAKNWMNDPNAPMYYNGVYHLFYQYNPKGVVWGNIVWAHSVSTDMVNWKKVEIALKPSTPWDKYGCWSGSATIVPGKGPVIMYTGIIDDKDTQIQVYAVPANLSDPYLREWIKPDDNPIMIADHPYVNKTAFRDPTTAWLGPDGHWRTTIGSRRRMRGMSFLYRSRDFVHWTKAKHPLHSKNGTGNWECPDFFPVEINSKNGLDESATGPNVRHVLKLSLDSTRYDYYTIGSYSTETDRYVPDKDMIDGWNGLRLDYGNFYASKSFFDPVKNRRIIWGWANESDATEDDVKKGWAGIQLVPRTITLDPNGKQLITWPIEELETLRGREVTWSNKKMEMGEKIEVRGVTPAQADVDVTFSFESLDKAEPFDPTWDQYKGRDICGQRGSHVQGGLGPFGLLTLASENLEEYTPVFFRIFKDQDKHKVLLCSDASRSTLSKTINSEIGFDAYRPSFGGIFDVDLTDKKLSLRTLIDNSVVESFGQGGKICVSSRVYPILAVFNNAHLYAFNNGSETITIDNLSAWSMARPKQMNH